MPGWNLQDYEPVEDRIRAFWTEHPDGRITTDMVHVGPDGYIVKASVWRDATAEKEVVGNYEVHGTAHATGYAQEAVTDKGVNATSALENCETSAIGRALANLGYAAKGKRPSREEMSKASSPPSEARSTSSTPPGAQRAARGTGVSGGDASVPTPSEAGASKEPTDGTHGQASPSAPASDDVAAPTGAAASGGGALDKTDSGYGEGSGSSEGSTPPAPHTTNYLTKDDQGLLKSQYGGPTKALNAYRARFGERITRLGDITYEMRDEMELEGSAR